MLRLKQSAVVGAVLLFCAGACEASFFSDLLRGFAVAQIEEREIQKAPDCKLSADEALARSIELLSDGRQAEAEDLIKSAIKSHRDDIRILFAKGVLERSRYNKDAGDVWFALTRKAKGDKTLSRAAWLSVQLDRKRLVNENLDELIRLSDENPDNVFLLWLGALQCREQSKQDDDIEIAERGRERYEMLLGKFQIGPIMLHQFYANILAETLKDYETAMEHRVLAVSMEATGWSLFGMGNTLVSMKNYEWASAVLARAVRTNPYSSKYVNCWGDALYYLKRYEEAAEKYRKAIRLQPKKGSYWNDLAGCLKKQDKREDEMFKAYQWAVELGYDRALGNFAWCYRYGHGVEKNEEEAFKNFFLYAEKTDSAYARYSLGDCYSKGIGTEKDLHKALEYYEEAIKVDPDYSDALNALAWFLVVSKDTALRNYPRAIELAKRSIALDENKYNLDTLAVAYFKNGQCGEAVKTQERIIEFWRSTHPGKPVSEGKLKRLEKYKKAEKEPTRAPAQSVSL